MPVKTDKIKYEHNVVEVPTRDLPATTLALNTAKNDGFEFLGVVTYGRSDENFRSYTQFFFRREVKKETKPKVSRAKKPTKKKA